MRRLRIYSPEPPESCVVHEIFDCVAAMAAIHLERAMKLSKAVLTVALATGVSALGTQTATADVRTNIRTHIEQHKRDKEPVSHSSRKE